ncbi:MAG TPA: aldo/keto reductase [Sphingomonas sp.]|nr:aldo/keto reductase [Sphingomonas sp.]
MKRRLASSAVNPIGLGCMSLSHAYGIPPARDEAVRLLNQALDLGYDHLDTAALYGFGANETLLGEAIAHRRDEYFLASKCGMTGVDGKRVIDGRPETLRKTIDEALGRLRTDRIDLYYLHRWDKSVPVEESVGELARMVAAGKIGAIGLSEVSAATLRRAHAVHPIAAVQNEYSLWSRNVELGVLDATREIGAALVAFSPVARGFLAGGVPSLDVLPEKDIRRAMPRFQPFNFGKNLALLDLVREIGAELGITPAQLCLQWLLGRGDHVLPIPGTTSPDHLAENFATPATPLPAQVIATLDAAFVNDKVTGHRYPRSTLPEIDTEDFEAAA